MLFIFSHPAVPVSGHRLRVRARPKFPPTARMSTRPPSLAGEGQTSQACPCWQTHARKGVASPQLPVSDRGCSWDPLTSAPLLTPGPAPPRLSKCSLCNRFYPSNTFRLKAMQKWVFLLGNNSGRASEATAQRLQRRCCFFFSLRQSLEHLHLPSPPACRLRLVTFKWHEPVPLCSPDVLGGREVSPPRRGPRPSAASSPRARVRKGEEIIDLLKGSKTIRRC